MVIPTNDSPKWKTLFTSLMNLGSIPEQMDSNKEDFRSYKSKTQGFWLNSI